MYDTAAIVMFAGPSHRQYTTTASHWDWPTISMTHQPATSAMALDDATACFLRTCSADCIAAAQAARSNAAKARHAGARALTST
ncbi:hypothetical protein [Xanthomonas sp. fls2-241-TYG-148]|uniref:hypothetical protein n=1 Tax=Xanthomonas sp. fls2-241-TYG-148 TaxID=3040328 RepID=UPI002554ABDE|nr:hypothetical protein [Xanthomonas sp. fls2-241-TYG-148]